MRVFLKMSSSPHGRDRTVFREMLSMLLKMRHAPNEIPNISIKGILNENLVTLKHFHQGDFKRKFGHT